jgi:hypothetical protein
MKGDTDMAIVWKKQRERQSASGNVMDRFVDGKVIDTFEMHDRIVMFQQLGIMLSIPQKRAQKDSF